MKTMVLVALLLCACGGAVSSGDDAGPTDDEASADVAVPPVSGGDADAARDASALPLAVRCAEAAGASCDPATFPPACCTTADDGAVETHACDDGGVVTVSATCAR